MKKEKKVLIVVDPQNGFKNKNTEKALCRINEIADYFDVIFTSVFFNSDKALYKEVLHWHNFSKHKDKKYLELAINKNDKMKVHETTGYTKLNWKLKMYLKMNKIDTVYVCGLQTDVSVYKTALDLFDFRVKPIIISDACGSCRGKTNHEMGLKMARRQIGEDNVLTFDEIKDKLEHKVVELF